MAVFNIIIKIALSADDVITPSEFNKLAQNLIGGIVKRYE